jgi:regulator of RNase E activity RraA
MPPRELISDAELAAWRSIPTAAISDELNHSGVMAAAIKPLLRGTAVAGQALTILTHTVDNGAPRTALEQAWPNAVIVIDARAHPDTAVWGGNLIAIAKAGGVAAVVVDGNVRDVVELRASGVAVFCRGVTPAGPVWGGSVNVPIRCSGVQVSPGDLVVGDDDGVVVVPPQGRSGLLDRCRERVGRDEAFQARLAAGSRTARPTPGPGDG